MKVRIRSLSGRIPAYQTKGAAGMDICAFLEEPVTLEAGQRALVPTGLFVEIPEGYEIQIRARSGLAMKHGIGLVNGIGTIDSDYRGEIGILLINWGEEPFQINNGDRIAQMVFSKIERMELVTADVLKESERSSGGFGSTGV